MNGYREIDSGSFFYRLVFGLFGLIYIVWGIAVLVAYGMGECFPDHTCGTSRPAEMWTVLLLLVGLPVACGLAARRSFVLGSMGLVLSMPAIWLAPRIVGKFFHWLVS